MIFWKKTGMQFTYVPAFISYISSYSNDIIQFLFKSQHPDVNPEAATRCVLWKKVFL